MEGVIGDEGELELVADGAGEVIRATIKREISGRWAVEYGRVPKDEDAAEHVLAEFFGEAGLKVRAQLESNVEDRVDELWLVKLFDGVNEGAAADSDTVGVIVNARVAEQQLRAHVELDLEAVTGLPCAAKSKVLPCLGFGYC